MEEPRGLLAAYMEYSRLGGWRKEERDMKGEVKKLFRFLEEWGLGIAELGAKEATAYQGWLLESRTKDGSLFKRNTVLYYLTGATQFYSFLKKKKLVLTNPFLEIRRIKGKQKIPRYLPKEKELAVFLKSLENYLGEGRLEHKINKYKTHVVAELMYASGIRLEEAAGLKVKDIDFKKGTVNIQNGKGGISRVGFLNGYALEVLRLYIERMRDYVNSDLVNRELLFGLKPWRFETIINRVLKQEAAALGYGKITCHTLRHCLGYHLLKAGCDVRKIQEILGHRRLKNTEIYTKVDKEELKHVLETYHPRKWRRSKADETGNAGSGGSI